MSIQLYQSAGLLCVTLNFMFLLCLIGHLATEKSFSIGDLVYTSLWYIFPLKHRFYALLVIQQSHRAFKLTAYGLIDCNLETFAMVNID